VISPACRSFLNGLRSQVLAGGVVNTTTTGPIVWRSPDAYTWAFSAGVKRDRQQHGDLGRYVGNRGRDNTGSSTSTRDRWMPRGASRGSV
jgi:hypothetical protein